MEETKQRWNKKYVSALGEGTSRAGRDQWASVELKGGTSDYATKNNPYGQGAIVEKEAREAELSS